MSEHPNASAVGDAFTISGSLGFSSSDRPIGHSLRAFADSAIRTWRRQLTERSCRAATLYLSSLDDDALAGIGLRRTEIPSAVHQLKAALLNRSRSASQGDIQ